jgi:hypothetical protein
MSQLINGSVCLTELIAKAKESHSAFTKASNGKIYANITIWVNDEPDIYGNIVSLQLNSTQEKRAAEGKVYIGNGKPSKKKDPEPVTAADVQGLDDDLPF